MVLSCKPLIADLHTLLRLSVKKLNTPYAKIVTLHLFKTQDPGDHPLSSVTYQSRPREHPPLLGRLPNNPCYHNF